MVSSSYDNTDLKSILNHAQKLVGKTVLEILSQSKQTNNLKSGDKGGVGKIVERHWFEIEPNNSSEPDFDLVGVELKVIPLIEQKRGVVVKERTKVCSIDYKKLVLESWNDSHAKKKLNKILFIYYLYDKTKIENSIIKKIDLWELNQDSSEAIIKNDWLNIQRKVYDGYAHELSERQSKILSPSRSGSGGEDKSGKLRDLVFQPNQTYSIGALKRAFSLKQSFTNQRWKELTSKIQYESIIDSLKIDDFNNFELVVLRKINQYSAKSIQELSDVFNLQISSKSKNQIAAIIKKAIGFKSFKSNIKEFEQLGIIVKTIKVRKSDNKPLEAISFPAMKLQEFIGEIWEESTFLEYINKILFIPVYHNSSSLSEKYLGRAFFWSPSLSEIQIIKKEWNEYRLEVLAGKCKTVKIPNNSKKGYREVSFLSKESQRDIIHMRPHGRDSNDRDDDNMGNSIVKQCFWLNKIFIQKLINELGR